jgi:hypothetical protein
LDWSGWSPMINEKTKAFSLTPCNSAQVFLPDRAITQKQENASSPDPILPFPYSSGGKIGSGYLR